MLTAFYLIIAHFLADFILQTDWMAINKSKRWDALFVHVGIYTLVMLIVTWSIPLAVVTFGAHFLTDAATSRVARGFWPILPFGDGTFYDAEGTLVDSLRYRGIGLKRSRHWFFVTIGFDQVLHYAQLFLTASWLGWHL